MTEEEKAIVLTPLHGSKTGDWPSLCYLGHIESSAPHLDWSGNGRKQGNGGTRRWMKSPGDWLGPPWHKAAHFLLVSS